MVVTINLQKIFKYKIVYYLSIFIILPQHLLISSYLQKYSIHIPLDIHITY